MFGFKKRQRSIVLKQDEIKTSKVLEADIELKKEHIMNMLQGKKLPVILLDPLWYTAKEHIKSEDINEGEQALKDLLKEQARLNTDYKEYTVIKQNFLKEILEISSKVQETEDQEATQQLSCLHQSTLGANSKLAEIEERLDHMDEEIQEKNTQVIAEMAAIGYGYIEKYKEEAAKLEAEIETLRLEMLKKTNQKKEDEASIKAIYHYLHSVVGRDPIEVMDKAFNEKKEKKES